MRIAHADLRAGGFVWHWAQERQDAIDRHWQEESRRNANYFNGTIYLIDVLAIDEQSASVTARFLKTDFKSYLYWRDLGYPDADVLDGFGSGLILAQDGAVILGRQQPGNINSGLAYLPGGFIDGRDVTAEGNIDIAASVRREIREETGLSENELTPGTGLLLTLHKAHVSFAITFRSHLEAGDLQAKIASHIACEANPELADAVVVRDRSDMRGLEMPGYARVLLSALLV